MPLLHDILLHTLNTAADEVSERTPSNNDTLKCRFEWITSNDPEGTSTCLMRICRDSRGRIVYSQLYSCTGAYRA